ncbi:MAG: glycosyltransferase [Muribaculaceae bacterium]|nr:glycosyltransferase [Muribaculaceae bacterium]
MNTIQNRQGCIDCFLPYSDPAQMQATVNALKQEPSVANIYLLSTDPEAPAIEGCSRINIDSINSSATMRAIAGATTAGYALLYNKTNRLDMGYLALERMLRIAADTGAGMLYSDYVTEVDGKRTNAPVIDYQEGALRDDFNFGSVVLFDSSVLRFAARELKADYKSAGFYDLRLHISRMAPIVHINEYLYSDVTVDNRRSGEKIFDYVDPKNRAVQIEMEQACTEHLKAVGAYLEPEFKLVDFSRGDFPREASVVIPVRNRVRTIRDAIDSALSQQTDFDFNVIVVDNHSTDGTTEAIREYAGNPRVLHIIPERVDLGIGGCWNMAANHPEAGRFAVQLDSDDVYSSPNTLATIVNAFHLQNCGMVVGTYMLTDIDCNPIPPGVIDHKEWTPDNGRNNALRINGLGAPRAFFTPLLREITVPNTSYGEDYALGLAFSRNHQIGRIYDVLYFCRRWEDNSDANLSIEKTNANNLYKDRIRTWELQARKAMNLKNA